MTTGIFYGSSTGNTAALAKQIATKLGLAVAAVHEVSKATISDAEACELLLLGSSTWGLGELQDDWYDFLARLKKASLSGKRVALFGCGDSGGFSDTFCDALAIIRDELAATGCIFVGQIDLSGNNYSSRAFEDGKAIGLTVDDSAPEATGARLEAWIEAITNS
ncbi:MAG: flavodoxin [Rikenellaceae bacterium]|jgi:flavodoxin I|nr:flavodoxin [Rikenellaceae bacterium]